MKKTIISIIATSVVGSVAMAEITSYEKKSLNRDTPMANAVMEVVFSHYDNDGEFGVSEDELADALRDLHQLLPPPDHHMRQPRQGMGDRSEREGGSQRGQHRPDTRELSHRLLDNHDSNRDGQLSPDELKQALTQANGRR